jgi:hypothetical protein
VFDRIQRAIKSGAYAVDERLPTEHDLAAEFQVSRPVVRDALQRLRDQGLIYWRRGAGSFVREQGIREPLGFGQMENLSDLPHCYRLTIEPQATAMAAQRHTPEALFKIKSALSLLRDATNRQAHRADADFEGERNHASRSRANASRARYRSDNGGVLFIPAGFTFFWMTVFGNTAIFIDTGRAAGALGEAVANDVSVGLFKFFEYLPLSGVTSTVAIILVAIFFVTSADSGAIVVDMIAAGGETKTTLGQRLFWCALEGLVAAVLLIAGGLGALQSAIVASALPFALVMLVLLCSLIVGMRADLSQQEAQAGHHYLPLLQPAAVPSRQARLALILNPPSKGEIERFIATQVRPALEQVARVAASTLNGPKRSSVSSKTVLVLISKVDVLLPISAATCPASDQERGSSGWLVGTVSVRRSRPCIVCTIAIDHSSNVTMPKTAATGRPKKPSRLPSAIIIEVVKLVSTSGPSTMPRMIGAMAIILASSTYATTPAPSISITPNIELLME